MKARFFSVVGLAVVLAGVGGTALPLAEPTTRPPGSSPGTPDTTIAARPGDMLVAETVRGTLTVRVGDEGRVRVVDEDGESNAGLVREGNRIRVTALGGADVDLVVEVPRGLAVLVRGHLLDVDVRGLEGRVEIHVFVGDLRLEDLAGGVVAETMNGEIDAQRLEGDVALTTMAGDVTLAGARGPVRVEGTDSELELFDVVGSRVTAVTVDGDVTFEGEVEAGGILSLTTHDGDVLATLPASVGAEVEVSTFDGEFESGFPVRTRGFQAGRPLTFTLGSGGRQVILRSFDGDIRLFSREDGRQ